MTDSRFEPESFDDSRSLETPVSPNDVRSSSDVLSPNGVRSTGDVSIERSSERAVPATFDSRTSSPSSEFLPSDRPTRRCSPTQRLAYLVFALCFLIGLALLPSLAERISYSISKGAESSKREEALRFLQECSDSETRSESRIPWIVKAISPSVVAINTSLRNGPGLATGVIVDAENGYIVTNFHVICDGDRLVEGVEVCLSDGRKQSNQIELVGFDEQHDLAVLKVLIPDLKAIVWGDSDELEVGESILAIGNPYGLTHTVTQGIVSAKERRNATPDGVGVQEYLQTDAAINPGNSGGPLVNVRGELVGINTAIFGDRYQGISFAIPVNLVKNVYQKIVGGATAKQERKR